MYVRYNKESDQYVLEYTEKDKCSFCKLEGKCPLISAIYKWEYCIGRYSNIPTEEFCEAYEPSERLKSLEKTLKKNRKTKEC